MAARLTIEQQIKKHEQQAQRLKAKLSGVKRRKETRRKILIGVAVDGRAPTDHFLRQRVGAILDEILVRADDRELVKDLLPGSSAAHGDL